MLPVAREPTDEESEMSIAMKALQDRLKASAYYLTEPKKTGGNEKPNTAWSYCKTNAMRRKFLF